MRSNRNTGTEEREQWKARILRALAELRRDERPGASASGDDEAREEDEAMSGAPVL